MHELLRGEDDEALPVLRRADARDAHPDRLIEVVDKADVDCIALLQAGGVLRGDFRDIEPLLGGDELSDRPADRGGVRLD